MHDNQNENNKPRVKKITDLIDPLEEQAKVNQDRYKEIGSYALGEIPYIGALLSETFGVAFPTRRAKRAKNLLVSLESFIDTMVPNINLDDIYEDELNIDLFEEAIRFASNSISEKKIKRISYSTAKGISGDEKEKLYQIRVIRCIDNLDEDEVDHFLNFYSDIVRGPYRPIDYFDSRKKMTKQIITEQKFISLGLISYIQLFENIDVMSMDSPIKQIRVPSHNIELFPTGFGSDFYKIINESSSDVSSK